MSLIAFVPARGASQRVPHKALRELGGHPLIEYTLAAAYYAGLRTVVATDDREIGRLALEIAGKHYDPDMGLFLRQPAGDGQADIEWVREVLDAYPEADPLMILRPTAPFRSSSTISRALALWRQVGEQVDSMRAVIPSPLHPGKIWRLSDSGRLIVPFLDERRPDGVPWHSAPTQTLPTALVQTAGLEIFWRRTAEAGSIAGSRVAPFLVNEGEALDINTESDLTGIKLARVSA